MWDNRREERTAFRDRAGNSTSLSGASVGRIGREERGTDGFVAT